MSITAPARYAMRLDRSLGWRKKELTQQKLIADASTLGDASVLRRSGITLLYAHWEGFIKESSELYIKYISVNPVDLSRLKPCFLAVALSGEIRVAGQAKKTSAHISLINTFQAINGAPPPTRRIPSKNVISTKANLKSEVLREIFVTLGLDYSGFQLKEKPVVDHLVKLRNGIAHGRGQRVDSADYNLLHSEIIALLDLYKDLIQDAIYNNSYLI